MFVEMEQQRKTDCSRADPTRFSLLLFDLVVLPQTHEPFKAKDAGAHNTHFRETSLATPASATATEKTTTTTCTMPLFSSSSSIDSSNTSQSSADSRSPTGKLGGSITKALTDITDKLTGHRHQQGSEGSKMDRWEEERTMNLQSGTSFRNVR